MHNLTWFYGLNYYLRQFLGTQRCIGKKIDFKEINLFALRHTDTLQNRQYLNLAL